MNLIQKYIIEKFLAGWLKKELDRIPFDGLKTILSCIVLVSTMAKVYFPNYAPYIELVVQFLNSVGISDNLALDLGLTGAIAGLIHKALKWLADRVNKTKNYLPLAAQ